ncbi:MAG: LAGLIDADG family homing endonuclease, partial [Candidatus Methanoperedens sp.]|nr:LAGLIDADG family homing endonuclease [Candidatus Methanoperedens sp.]
EKSDKREMKPAPHVLFPIGEAGGRRRSLQNAKDHVEEEDNGAWRNNEFGAGLTVQKEKVGTIKVQIGQRYCPSCRARTFKNRCACGKFTLPLLKCQSCGIEVQKPVCPKCQKETSSVMEMDIDFKSECLLALKNLGERDNLVSIKGVLGLTSKNKTPEPLEKGILRAKHGIVMFKDGTVRYDLSDMPLTHIKPKEIGVPVEKLRELGYDKDVYGKPLVDDSQILELKVQDIVVSKDCGEYLLKTAGFIDDLLTKYYKVDPYYNISSISELIGKLVIGLAPHTSAGVLGRLVGFTTASVGYAHPFFHAAKRRNCFHGDEKLLVYRGDGFELLTIRELVEGNLIGKTEKDDVGTEYKKIHGLKTYAFNIKTKKFELADITHVSRHISPERLIEIRTKSGRKLVVTKDHPFPDRSGAKLKAMDADELLIPWNIERPFIETKENFEDLNIGIDEKTKRIPDFVYALPQDKISEFLRGYFTENGSCFLESALDVNVTSVNEWLIDGVSYLLMFSGIKHSIHEDKIRIYGAEAEKFIEDIGFLGEKQKRAEGLLKKWLAKKGSTRTSFDEDVFIDKVVERKEIESKDKYVYNLTVDTHHSLICSGITTFQCDGDEDCVMLLMDGLLNFSRSYLPDKRGGQMDAPLVLTSRIDPNEVDKEAHNIDVLFQYPLEFYEATLKYTHPKDIVKLLDTVSGRLGTPSQYEGFGFTHDTTDIAAGPRNSAYKTLGTMIEKMEAQLALARRIKAVDPQDVAERVIESHFLPDLIGNLRSFSKQKVRCTKCNAKYRRPPLRGTCPKCGGNIVLTVHEGSVKKYLETSLRIADEYNVRHYTKQRLELLELEMKSLFESDKVKQKGLADFM